MALPNGAGGYQLGDGNLTEATIGVQTAPITYAAAASPLLSADLTNGIIYYTGSGNNLQLPLGVDLDAAISSAKTNSSIDFNIIANGGTATITTNTGWTLIGTITVPTTTSGAFRARKTGTGTWTLYRIS